jgi:hypothetical protein
MAAYRSVAHDLDELLAGIALLVEVADIPRGHGLVERDRDSVMNTTEPLFQSQHCEFSKFDEGDRTEATWGMKATVVPRWVLISRSWM